jgi:glycosyltransferase involved in cell wall biosynthesis
VIRASYHDGNLATYLRHPQLVLDRDERRVRAAWAHERAVYDRLDVIMTMSEWVRRSFIDDFGQDPRKVVVVGAGANELRVPPVHDRDLRQPRVLFVGRGDFTRKGGPQLLRAFRRLRQVAPDAELWLVGPTPPPTTEPGVTCYGVIRRDDIAGREQLEGLFANATVFAMPSVYEPFGIAFLEAMSHRLPVIGGNTCAMPEIIDEGTTGWVVDPDDERALTQRLVELAADPEQGRRMGEAGYARFVRHYTWDEVAKRVLQALELRRPGA